jgi:hypothetical protein
MIRIIRRSTVPYYKSIEGHSRNEVDHVFLVMEDWLGQLNGSVRYLLCSGANVWTGRVQDGASQSMMPPQSEMHAQMHARMMQMMHGSGMHSNAGQHGMMECTMD